MKITCVFSWKYNFLAHFSYWKHKLFKKGDIHALNVGAFMSPVSCTKVILPNFFSQINLSLVLRSQIKIYFITLCLCPLNHVQKKYFMGSKKFPNCAGPVQWSKKNYVLDRTIINNQIHLWHIISSRCKS